MDELRGERAEKHDADAPLAHENSSWFARELSEDWQEIEPGIFRHVEPQLPDNPHSSQAPSQTNSLPEVEVLKQKGLEEMSEKLLDKARRSPG